MGDRLPDRIIAVAEAYFQRSGCTKFPPARYVAKRLRIRLAEIEECEGDGYCLDGVNVEGWKLGDLEVYVTRPPEVTHGRS